MVSSREGGRTTLDDFLLPTGGVDFIGTILGVRSSGVRSSAEACRWWETVIEPPELKLLEGENPLVPGGVYPLGPRIEAEVERGEEERGEEVPEEDRLGRSTGFGGGLGGVRLGWGGVAGAEG